ncbi:uncharacterized protein LOC144291439 isoform X2 [Canis aureus]
MWTRQVHAAGGRLRWTGQVRAAGGRGRRTPHVEAAGKELNEDPHLLEPWIDKQGSNPGQNEMDTFEQFSFHILLVCWYVMQFRRRQCSKKCSTTNTQR